MLGGTPRCERCHGAVYHAEQVMGPGRRIYHKLCLKCENCGKRLDQGSLVQHDNLPYCNRCHTQLFGTRDLRHANLHSSPSTSPARPRPGPGPEQDPAPPPRLTPRPVAAPQEYYTPPADVDADGDAAPSSSAAARPPPALPSRPRPEATDGPLVQTSDLTPGSRAVGAGLRSGPPPVPARPGNDDEPEVTRVNFRAERPMPSGVSSAIASGLASKDSPRSKVGVAPGYEDRCQGCEKRVYAAEQVFAIGHKWHRGCLRCASCRSTIDPSRVSDREGVPYCKNCYAREHGPGGIAGKR